MRGEFGDALDGQISVGAAKGNEGFEDRLTTRTRNRLERHLAARRDVTFRRIGAAQRREAFFEKIEPVEAPIPLALEIEHRTEIMPELAAQPVAFGKGVHACIGHERRHIRIEREACKPRRQARIAEPIGFQHVGLRRRRHVGRRHGMDFDIDIVARAQQRHGLHGKHAVGVARLMEIMDDRPPPGEPPHQRADAPAQSPETRTGDQRRNHRRNLRPHPALRLIIGINCANSGQRAPACQSREGRNHAFADLACLWRGARYILIRIVII